ncbi:FkbM family methyltransferase [Ramlibacter sp. WS9]|uniref:FkbM family methyltransferase n=1 Tax=Ramlibacter sp. WS9 TaxID=1882741 RepID=UPI001143F48F|nr:FkbM family methyltransferase [Ramlibacter sp. WS9]ROZ66352.1 FkbM family methyltransferase [Ramlibacter sp. WS9]
MIEWLIDVFFIKQPRLRRFVTRMLYGNRLLSATLLGSTFHVHSVKENGYLRASKASARLSALRDETPVLLSLANIISNNCAFVDIGANVGLYSIVFSRFKRIHEDFHVYAFEVHPDTFTRLEANAHLHGFSAMNVGVGERQERVQFVGGAVSHVTTRADISNQYNIAQEVFAADIVPLANIAFAQRDLIIKIDVEGQEMAVLEGARMFFDEGRVKGVYIDGYVDAKCWDFLESFGFDMRDGKTLEAAGRETFSLLALRR